MDSDQCLGGAGFYFHSQMRPAGGGLRSACPDPHALQEGDRMRMRAGYLNQHLYGEIYRPDTKEESCES